MLDILSTTRLIFITGKGGVGKSTTTAALGLALAQSGKRTLVIETDTYSAMANLLNVKLDHGKITKHSENLWLQNLRSEDALVHIIHKFLPSERLSRSVTQNRVARVFFNAAPSVNEFSLLNQVYDYYHDEKNGRHTYDHIVVDLPASGHAVTFLNVPQTLNGMMKGIGGFAALAKKVGDVIQDTKKCAIVAVCLPEEMPVNETIELDESFKTLLGRPMSLTWLNMVHDVPFDMKYKPSFEALKEAQQGEALTSHVLRANDLALQWYERDNYYVNVLRERLACPIEELPMFYEVGGQQVVQRLADFMINPS